MNLAINQNTLKYQPQLSAQPNNKLIPFKSTPKAQADVVDIQGIVSDPAKEAKINEIVKAIKNAKNVAILTHRDPDGDAVGSELALRSMIAQQKNIEKVEAFIVDDMPNNFKSLEDTKFVKYITRNTPEDVLNEKYDLVITVDAARKDMLGRAMPIFDNADKTIQIDHHPGSEDYAQIRLVDENASSASQIIKELAKPLGVDLDKNIASDLYLALISDTQGFRFPKDPVKAFKDAMDLAKTGIDTNKIYRDCMDTITKPLLKLYSDALQRIQFAKDGKVAYIIEDQNTKRAYPEEAKKDRTGIKQVLTSILELIMPNIKGVQVAIKLNEVSDGTTISLRGKDITVNDIAAQFGGGGHEYAAGGKINAKPEEALNQLLSALERKMLT